jgi:membrane associated rhomboid family serine protease
MQPLVLWLAGIAALVVLLVVLGGFQRTTVSAVAGGLFIGLLVAYFFSKRSKRK